MTNKKRARPAAMILTPSQSSCRVCWEKSKPCFSLESAKLHPAIMAGSKKRNSSHSPSPRGRPAACPSPSRQSSLKKPLAKIRHGLRTPINHIIGFSEMLLEDAPGRMPESFLRDLQKIRGGGDRLLALINEHLSPETFPSGKPDLHQLCHELRTPVNHIIGYSELLLEQCADAGQGAFTADLMKIVTAAKTWLAL